MITCELCGGKGANIQAVIEGSTLTICNKCSKYGNVVKIIPPNNQTKEKIKKILQEPEIVRIIVKDYNTKIKQAREQQQLTQEQLGLKLNEKESIIHKIEAGNIEPDIVLTKKIEHLLHITLLEDYAEPPQPKVNLKNAALTIGDLIKIKKKP
ncbi:MAG: multiprotein bridging factor aMBF1 [Nanoarchaeota archaeon]|nr:multiprotein bridging factor aMBF1 [Nanoarchaeota archaeon]